MRDAFDERLSMALHDVPVPDGLGQRILAKLVESEPSDARIAAPRGTSRLRTRRWLLVGSGLLTAAAAVFLAVWLGLPETDVLSEQFVLDEAIQTFDAAVDASGASLAEKPAPADYPFSPAVLAIRGVRWHSVEGVFSGRRGVVYQLPGAAGTGAALFVVDAGSADEFADTPAVHPFTTAGCCASAWVEGGLLYVLVVQGDPTAYRAYLNLPHGPLA